MIRAYLVDDEPLALDRLARLLEATGRAIVVGRTTDPETAVVALRSTGADAVDALFLDVQMPGLSGFELLERLEHPPAVVFVTAYDAYALNAFAVDSIDYLLKPVEPERLDRALDKLARLGASQGPDVRALARELASRLATPRRLERVASRVGGRTTLIDTARISYFFAKDKLTFAVENGREHVVDFTLSELEQALDSRRFVRIHRSTIVATAFVHELYPGVDGMIVRLRDEQRTELAVARDRLRALKARLGIP